jgi:hypothetical protein
MINILCFIESKLYFKVVEMETTNINKLNETSSGNLLSKVMLIDTIDNNAMTLIENNDAIHKNESVTSEENNNNYKNDQAIKTNFNIDETQQRQDLAELLNFYNNLTNTVDSGLDKTTPPTAAAAAVGNEHNLSELQRIIMEKINLERTRNNQFNTTTTTTTTTTLDNNENQFGLHTIYAIRDGKFIIYSK